MQLCIERLKQRKQHQFPLSKGLCNRKPHAHTQYVCVTLVSFNFFVSGKVTNGAKSFNPAGSSPVFPFPVIICESFFPCLFYWYRGRIGSCQLYTKVETFSLFYRLQDFIKREHFRLRCSHLNLVKRSSIPSQRKETKFDKLILKIINHYHAHR